MAQKRMFDKAIIRNDKFLDMPPSTQNLYFHLGMEADDEGFVSPKMVMRTVGANDDELKVLVAKKLVIPFDSGVTVITDWRENNWLDSRRIKPTQHQDEKALLTLENNKYALCRNPLSKKLHPLSQSSIEEYSIEENRVRNPAPKVARPTLEEIENYIKEKQINFDSKKFFYYYESNGWKVGKNPMKNWRMAIMSWHSKDNKEIKNLEVIKL